MMKIHPCVRKTKVFFYFAQILKYLFWYLALWVDGVAHVIRVQVQVAISRSLSSGSLPKIKPPLPGVAPTFRSESPKLPPHFFRGPFFNLVRDQGRVRCGHAKGGRPSVQQVGAVPREAPHLMSGVVGRADARPGRRRPRPKCCLTFSLVLPACFCSDLAKTAPLLSAILPSPAGIEEVARKSTRSGMHTD